MKVFTLIFKIGVFFFWLYIMSEFIVGIASLIVVIYLSKQIMFYKKMENLKI